MNSTLKAAGNLTVGDVVLPHWTTDPETVEEFKTTVTEVSVTKTGRITVRFSDGSRCTRKFTERFIVEVN